jgi:uncharacterized protein
MEKSIKITIIVAITLVALALIGVFTVFQMPFAGGNVITVDGTSSIKVSPDIVSVYFNVETNGTTAKDAKDSNAKITDDLITALVKEGFNRNDIQTLSFNIYENQIWENNKYVSHGYKASHQIRVQMNTSQSDKIGEVIDAGVDSGALLSYINFELSTAKQNEYKAQALAQASQDAKTKAQAVASGSGMKLGRLVSISTSNFDYRPWNVYTSNAGGMMEDAIMAKQAATSIQPGEQDVSAYVSATYKLR